MYGCEWDDETGAVNGFNQYGHDGEDFISWDHETETWIAPTPQSVITKLKWDQDKALLAQKKNYLLVECPTWLKKHLEQGRSSLLRTERPRISLLQKSPSSPVSCHATGFYPDSAVLFWRREGEELHEDVVHGEVLPNHDGTFQMSADLKVSSISPEDWGRYECVFQIAGLKEDIVTQLDEDSVQSNREKPTSMTFIILIIIAAVVALAAVSAVIGLVVHRRKKAQCTSTAGKDPVRRPPEHSSWTRSSVTTVSPLHWNSLIIHHSNHKVIFRTAGSGRKRLFTDLCLLSFISQVVPLRLVQQQQCLLPWGIQVFNPVPGVRSS
ncbi:unnamed protein product [Pleuronectes platessa]|uniref:Ig-like domain-containing protein n=1 Tax=Pleuronectes platessa TaxID=8262 RepID=A0A9N7V4I8_PLEPL|nr:unnamed protein product [Pleuronectes platessa]